MNTAIVEGFQVTASDCGNYLYITSDGAPGQIHIKRESEGYVIDLLDDSPELNVVGSTYAFWPELERE